MDAFEPHPANRARLIDHLRDNQLIERVRVHEAALSDRSGVATIHMPVQGAANHGMASLFSPAGESEAVEVPTVRVDEAIAGARPRLIKIDVEGAEPLAVAGMAGLVQVERPPAIIAEYNVDTARQAGFRAARICGSIAALQPGYRVDLIGWRMRRIEDIDSALSGRAMANLLFTAEVGR